MVHPRLRIASCLSVLPLVASCFGSTPYQPRYGLQYNWSYFQDFEPLVGQQPGIQSWSSDPNVGGLGGFYELPYRNSLLFGGRARFGRHNFTQTFQPGLGYPDRTTGTVDGWFLEPYAGWNRPFGSRFNLGLQTGPVFTLNRADYEWVSGGQTSSGSRTHSGFNWQVGTSIDASLSNTWGVRGGANWTNFGRKDADNNRNVYLGFTYTKEMIARDAPPRPPGTTGGTRTRPPQPPGGTTGRPAGDSTPPVSRPPRDSTPTSRPPTGPPSRPPQQPPPRDSNPPVPTPPPPTSTPPRDPPSRPDSQPTPSCCGFRGTEIFYPKLTDARRPPSVQAAPRATASLASNVLVPNGAFFHQSQDLGVESVGFPFNWTRHYLSDFETTTGGMIGHRWDFTLDKRILPLGGTEAGQGLVRERPGQQQAQLMYFNGQGRAEIYVERLSGRRDNIANFATTFDAHVTAYRSPNGAFHEIERYVLFEPREHPFGGHPNVEPGEAIFFVLREKNGLRYVFNCRGQLIHILSRHDFTSYGSVRTNAGLDSVRLTVEYGGELNPITQSQMPVRIRDASNKVYSIATVEIGDGQLDTNFLCTPRRGPRPILRISRLSGAGTVIDYQYRPNTNEAILEAVKITTGSVITTTRYAYDGRHRLLRMTPPKQAAKASNDSASLVNTYDGSGRVTNQSLGGGLMTWRVSYTGTTRANAVNAAGDEFELQLRKVGPYYVTATEIVRSRNAMEGGPWTTRFEHNASTQVTALTLPRGNIVRYEYDTANEPVTLGSIRDFNAGTTYDNNLSLGNLLAVINERGTIAESGATPQRKSYEYEPLFNQLAKETDARGSAMEFTFAYNDKGEFGNPLRAQGPELTQPDGSKLRLAAVRYTYNTKGQVESIVDRRGAMTTFTYAGPEWFLKQVDYPGGAVRTHDLDDRGYAREEGGSFGTTRFQRDERGRVVMRESVVGPGFSNRVYYEYDLHNQVASTRTEITDNFQPGALRLPSGQTITLPDAAPKEVIATVEYDLLDRPVREVTGGIERKYEYDQRGNVAATVTPSPTGTGVLRTEFQYNGRGLVTRRTPGLEEAAFTLFEYDLNTNLTLRQSGPDTTRGTVWTYDAFDRVQSLVDGRGTKLERTYDDNGNLLHEVVTGRKGGASGPGKLLESEYEYNELNLVTRTKRQLLDRGGSVDEGRAFYTAAGDVDRMIDGGGEEKRFEYDAAGRTTAVIGPDLTTRTRYTPAGYPATVAEIEIERTWNHATGQTTQREASRTTGFTYDQAGRVTQQGGVGPEMRFYYNSQGLVRAQYEAGHGVAETQYDVLGQTLSMQRGAAFERLQYLPSGHVARHESPASARTFKYDALGRVLETSDEKTGAITFSDWNASGDLIGSTDPNGTRIQYTLDAMGAPTRSQITLGRNTFDDLGVARPTLVGPTWEEFEYDGLGRPVRAATSDRVSTTMEYDGIGRVVADVQERDGVQHRVERSYAPDYSWSEVLYPQSLGGIRVRHARAPSGQGNRVDVDGRRLADFTFSGGERVAVRSFANGVVASYTYDTDRRITGVEVSGPSGQASQRRSWWTSTAQYRDERLSRFVERRNNRGGSLMSESTSDFLYDAAGRRVSASATERRPVAGQPDAISATGSFTQYRSGRAEAMAEFAREGNRIVLARHDLFEHDAALRVTASTNSARMDVPAATRAATLTDVTTISTLVSQNPTATERQKFQYDRAGNLIADSTYLYAYDHANRLKRVTERSPRGSKESLFFVYDALGRRVFMTPTRDRAPLSFAQWAPWARQAVAFVYDGQHVIGELENGNNLLARYVMGAMPGDRIRMDRRRNDDPAAPLVSYYLHENAQGSVALASDSTGAPQWIGYAPAAGATPFRAPNDLHTIGASLTRSPYVGGSTRVDGFSGVRYDERSGTEMNDYRDNRALSNRADLYQMTQQMQAFTATTLTAMAAMAAAGITVVALSSIGVLAEVGAVEGFKYMLIGGAISVGAGALGAHWQGNEYTLGTAARDFGEGMVLGLVGGAMAKAGASLASIAAVDYATGYWSGFIRANPMNGLADAAAQGVTSGAFGATLGLGIGVLGRMARGEQSILSEWPGARRHSGTVPAISPNEQIGALNGRWQTAIGEAPSANGKTVETIYSSQAATRRELALERSILRYLERGTNASREVARLIRTGELDVRFSYETPQANFNGLFYEGTNYITINVSSAMAQQKVNVARQLASTVMHEGIHYLGGGELSAWWAQARFLMRLPGSHSAVPGVRYLSRNFGESSTTKMAAARKGPRGVAALVEREYNNDNALLFIGLEFAQVQQNAGMLARLVGLDGPAERAFVRQWLMKRGQIFNGAQLSIP